MVMSAVSSRKTQKGPKPTGKSLPQQVADRIAKWLEDPSGPSWALVDWLEGYNLPAVGPDEDPYVWLHRGLNELPANLYVEFILRLARFIDEQPDVARPGDRPDEVLYNLLLLCTRLGDRLRLGPPLIRMYERARRRMGLTGQTYRGLDLRNPLLLALIGSQYDRSLISVWFRMLQTGRDAILPGTEYSGFYGVLATDLPGQPNLDDLGQALSQMVRYLDRFGDKHQPKLTELLNRIYDTHPAESNELDRSFLVEAMTRAWPDWASRRLRRRWTALPGGTKIVALKEIWDELPAEFKGKRMESVGSFVKIEVDPREFRLFDSVGRGFDELLKSNPYKSRRSILGTLNLVLIDLEIRFATSDPRAAEIIAKTRRLLRSKIGQSRPTKSAKHKTSSSADSGQSPRIGDYGPTKSLDVYPSLMRDLGHLVSLTYESPTKAVDFCSNVVIPSLSTW
jgi:hypothetical protein